VQQHFLHEKNWRNSRLFSSGLCFKLVFEAHVP
jgi:hypothetical protein